MAAGIQYENPQRYEYSSTNPGVGTYAPQLVDFYFIRKALIDVKKDMYFSQLSDTMSMPKNVWAY